MVKWIFILFLIFLYSIVLFLPFTDLMLLIKYKLPEDCSTIGQDIDRITDNLFFIAFGGYYLSLTLIILILVKFNNKN
ncbi:hypothetical protein BS333_07470 [Vibrio azureus]|nr:hypothetical protein BS333_07470 [Vibrio azureus]